MPIPESQLETWSNQGAEVAAKTTADSIKNALQSYIGWPSQLSFSRDCEVYLQGSYKNNTNIRGDSDIDVVVQLNSSFMSNLSDSEKQTLGFTPSSYSWSYFRRDVLQSLRTYYGDNQVKEGKKSLKVLASSGRLPADVVVCLEYRKYSHDDIWFSPEVGMTFWIPSDQRWVINYPKIHFDRGVSKNQNTNGWYKPTVRIFKNWRNYMEQKGLISFSVTPSYFLECLIYNVSNNKFGINCENTVYGVLEWLNSADLETLVCQNGKSLLFGPAHEQWSPTSAREFINKAINLWNDWSNAPIFNKYR